MFKAKIATLSLALLLSGTFSGTLNAKAQDINPQEMQQQREHWARIRMLLGMVDYTLPGNLAVSDADLEKEITGALERNPTASKRFAKLDATQKKEIFKKMRKGWHEAFTALKEATAGIDIMALAEKLDTPRRSFLQKYAPELLEEQTTKE